MTANDRFDFRVAALTAITTAVTFAIAISTPPKGGPFCVRDCVGYPYTDVADFIPRDFLWLYPGMLPAPLFVVILGGIHERVDAQFKRASLLAIAFAAMAAAILTIDYFIQLRVIQPAVLKGELEGLAPLTQYNPHGVFIALEEAGYLLMAVAFGFAGGALSRQQSLVLAARRLFLAGCWAVLLLFAAMSAAYGFDLEYRFEVAAISVDWIVLIAASTLLALSYR